MSSIIEMAKQKKLFDVNNPLKLHKEQVSPLGGIAIFSAFWITLGVFSSNGLSRESVLLMAGAFLLFLTGVKDDLISMPALRRLVVQIGVASLMYVAGIQLTTIPGTGIVLPWPASFLLTILLTGAIVNAYNFIDGINGLASGLAIIGAVVFALLFLQMGNPHAALVAGSLAGSLLGFWFFNFGNAKIFMGDNGSTFVGIMLTYLVVTFLEMPAIRSAQPTLSPWIAFAIVSVPLADLVKVVLSRVLRGISPMKGDRTHIHHLFGGLGLGPRSVCFVLYGWEIFAIIFCIFLLPKDLYLSGSLLLLTTGLPYVVVLLAGKIQRAKKRPPVMEASSPQELS